MKTYSSLGSPGRNFSRAASVTSVRFVTAAAPFDGWFSWPCFLTLQASCTAHATLRTPGHENHPSKGAAAVTKRTLVTDAAREKFRPGEPREE